MSQNMRQLVRAVCGVLLIAGVGVVVWMANEISQCNIAAFRDWNSLYDFIAVGCIVFCCFLLGAMAVTSKGVIRLTLVLLGVSLLVSGIVGRYGFKYLSQATFVSESVYSRMKLKPNAAETVLGFHYLCRRLGGYVALGDGSVRYVDREQFVTLRHADPPDHPPEFSSPIKEPAADEPTENADVHQDNSEIGLALQNENLVQERIKHSSNLKWMAEDHFSFRPRDGIRRPLKPEHFTSYPGMTDELRKAISDGTYVWYFGWDPIDSNYYEETKASSDAASKALWYDFASWASVYLAGFGAGSLLASLTLWMKCRNPLQGF
jgi:hypothetical protein